ncbi:uncharacterized protein LOC126748148 [Anthonomus grandis grandis]|uniref:uncharacterized protein LOC126748148 n=1 Tax=Anthonomus grandis grandis TaxID=2921223 RepID=UPI00216518EF|nr:uncharacterized protein LOC126748148 [Anthonomus grandis grandis]
MSVQDSTFPEAWKHSFIMPIFKAGNRGDIANYRGVCIQNSLAKLFNSLVCGQLTWQRKGIISEKQSGFSSGKSTTSSLVQYECDLLGALERGVQTVAVYTDFSKAFDRVNFGLLLDKLESAGFHDSLLKWLKSFLIGRTRSVKVHGCTSAPTNVVSGVPQGSHCAPLLFNLFVNDIVNVINHSSVSMFAVSGQ